MSCSHSADDLSLEKNRFYDEAHLVQSKDVVLSMLPLTTIGFK